MPTNCPVCATRLRVTRLACSECRTALEGDFDLGRLGGLSREQLAFVEVFLECRGKIKDVEQRLGISYPTVVSRLDQVVEALVAKSAPEAPRAQSIDDVLAALSQGEITPNEAATLLKRSRSTRSNKNR
jgi:hypothetical protein